MRLVQLEQTMTALGGEATIGLVLPDTVDSARSFATLWEQTFRFERQFSRFIPESELSRFNARAGIQITISEEFRQLLLTAKQVATQTNGLINPFVLPAIQRTGYLHSALAQYASDTTPDYRERSVVEPSKLEVGDNWARIPYGTALDIGGFGKGYLADALGETARSLGAKGYWINLSGDIALYGKTAAGEPMQVAIQSADGATEASYRATCSSKPSGVATSGTFRRPGHEKHAAHHLIDPRTGKSAKTDIALATVHATSAMQADILASCAVILGSAKAKTSLPAQGASAGLLQLKDGGRELFGTSIKPTKELTHA